MRRCGVISHALSRQRELSSVSLRRLRLGVAAQASGTSLSDISATPARRKRLRHPRFLHAGERLRNQRLSHALMDRLRAAALASHRVRLWQGGPASILTSFSGSSCTKEALLVLFGDRGDTPRWGLMAGSVACCTTYIRCCPFGPCTVAVHGAPAHNRWGVVETPTPSEDPREDHGLSV